VIQKSLYSPEQKLEWWGDGEWVNEPDLAEFEEQGIRCFIRRFLIEEKGKWHLGILNGYASLPHNHSWNFSEKLRNNCEVHGGITFFGKWNDLLLYPGKPEPKSELNWVGFDTGHGFDLAPSMAISLGGIKCCVYKNMDYVASECKKMARQVKGNGLAD